MDHSETTDTLGGSHGLDLRFSGYARRLSIPNSIHLKGFAAMNVPAVHQDVWLA